MWHSTFCVFFCMFRVPWQPQQSLSCLIFLHDECLSVFFLWQIFRTLVTLFQICFHQVTCSSLRSHPEASAPPGHLLLLKSCLTWCVTARLKTSLAITFPSRCPAMPHPWFCNTFSPSLPMRSTSSLSMTKETVSH